LTPDVIPTGAGRRRPRRRPSPPRPSWRSSRRRSAGELGIGVVGPASWAKSGPGGGPDANLTDPDVILTGAGRRVGRGGGRRRRGRADPNGQR